MIKTALIETPLGIMKAAATKEGICFLGFIDSTRISSDLEETASLLEMEITSGSNRHIRALKRQLKDYFKGKRKNFDLKLLTPGTSFQKEVWDKLQTIPYGSTISYHRQSESLNRHGAERAVAHANASNRIAIVIPCHRVIGADGTLTGYAGGLERKQWLIDHEKKFTGQPVDGILF